MIMTVKPTPIVSRSKVLKVQHKKDIHNSKIPKIIQLETTLLYHLQDVVETVLFLI